MDQDAGHEISGGTGTLPPRFLRVDAAAIVDSRGTASAPGSILIELSDAAVGTFAGPDGRRGFHHARTKVLAVGSPAIVDAHPAANAQGLLHIRRPGCVLVPGLVNAHAHLDLTHIGPRSHDLATGFMGFVDLVRSNRLLDDEAIAASVQRGIDLSLAGGVVAVGDIAGSVRGSPSLAPLRTLAASPLWGVSFLEFFAFGKGQEASVDRALAALDAAQALETPRVRAGLSPHATYSVSPPMLERVLRYAKERSPPVPVCTHVAETLEEREFIARATGPFRDLLERLGLWRDDLLAHVGHGRGSLDHFLHSAEAVQRTENDLGLAPMLMAHVNDAPTTPVTPVTPATNTSDASDGLLRRASRAAAMVAYCPRASAYFGAADRFGPHRYRNMQDDALLVALGTDSVVTLEQDAAASARISTLDEMRLLARRDGTDPAVLLDMATCQGARAIGLDPGQFSFAPMKTLVGLLAIPCKQTPIELDSAIAWLQAAVNCETPPELLLVGK